MMPFRKCWSHAFRAGRLYRKCTVIPLCPKPHSSSFSKLKRIHFLLSPTLWYFVKQINIYIYCVFLGGRFFLMLQSKYMHISSSYIQTLSIFWPLHHRAAIWGPDDSWQMVQKGCLRAFWMEKPHLRPSRTACQDTEPLWLLIQSKNPGFFFFFVYSCFVPYFPWILPYCEQLGPLWNKCRQSNMFVMQKWLDRYILLKGWGIFPFLSRCSYIY